MTAVQGPPTAQTVLRAVAAYAPSYLLPALFGLATIPLLSRDLGPAEFGAYGVCLTAQSLMLTFAADPTTGATRRLYAVASRKGQSGTFVKAIFGLALFLASSVAAAVTLLALGAELLFSAGEWTPRLVVVAGATALFTVFQYAVTSLYVRERIRASALSQVIHTIGKTAALIAGALLFHTALGSFGVYGLILCVLLAAMLPAIGMPRPIIDRERWRESLHYGVPLIAVSLGLIVLTGFDRVALAAITSDQAAGQYTVAYLLSDFSVQALGLLLWYASYPSLVRQWELGHRDQARRALRATADMFAICGTAIVAVLAVAGTEVTRVIAGPAFHVPAVVPMLVGAGVLLFRVGGFEVVGFEFALQSRRLAGTFLAAALICVPATLVAIALGGLVGAAASTTASFGVFWALVRWRNPLRTETLYPVRRLAVLLLSAGCLVIAAKAVLPWQAAAVSVALLQPILGLSLLRRWSLVWRAVRPHVRRVG